MLVLDSIPIFIVFSFLVKFLTYIHLNSSTLSYRVFFYKNQISMFSTNIIKITIEIYNVYKTITVKNVQFYFYNSKPRPFFILIDLKLKPRQFK